MALLRALTTRRSSRGYERLLEVGGEENEEAIGSGQLGQFEFEAQLKRARSVPARVFGLSRKSVTTAAPQSHLQPLPEAKSDHLNKSKSKSKSSSASTASASSKKGTKSHPLFSLFDGGRKNNKKITAKPEFARYIEYLKEGGMWDMNSNMPVIYYK